MKKWLIDSDVLIDYLRGFLPAHQFLEKIIQRDHCCLSAISVAALYAGIREGKERQLLEKFLQIFNIISIDHSIAELAGIYKRDYSKKNGVGLGDTLIAATATTENAVLVTLNIKHFPMLKNAYIPYTKV